MTGHAIVLRWGEEEASVLLVRTSSGRRWTFPKGHREKGEMPEETALRELAEEAGYTAKAARVVEADAQNVFVLFTAARRFEAPEPGRDPCWFPISQAKIRLRANRQPADAHWLLVALDRAAAAFAHDPPQEQERPRPSPRPV